MMDEMDEMYKIQKRSAACSGLCLAFYIGYDFGCCGLHDFICRFYVDRWLKYIGFGKKLMWESCRMGKKKERERVEKSWFIKI